MYKHLLHYITEPNEVLSSPPIFSHPWLYFTLTGTQRLTTLSRYPCSPNQYDKRDENEL